MTGGAAGGSDPRRPERGGDAVTDGPVRLTTLSHGAG